MEKIAQAPSASSQILSHEETEDRYMARLRWRCRRGLLELDIIFGRFVPQSYAGLTQAHKEEFDRLLDLVDTVLWDKISGKLPGDNPSQQELLNLINAA